MSVYDVSPMELALRTPQPLIDACLYCRLKSCDENLQGCLFRQLVGRPKEKAAEFEKRTAKQKAFASLPRKEQLRIEKRREQWRAYKKRKQKI